MIAVGVDPGGAATGIVVVDGAECLWGLTENRGKGETIHSYALRVLHTLQAALDTARDAGDGSGILAVEAVTAPNPHVRLTNPRGAIDAAVVFGAVVAYIPGPAVVVQPGGHGSHTLSAYPASLRPARGLGRGRDRRRHERSAYDIAQAGIAQHRIQTLEGTP